MNSKDIQRVLHVDCKNASGGVTSLAYALGKSPTILGNKLNVECETNHLSFQEAIDLISMTNSIRTLSAMASSVEHILVPMPNCNVSNADIVQRFVDLSIQCGRLGQQMKKAMAEESELGVVLSVREKREMANVVQQMTAICLCLELELDEK